MYNFVSRMGKGCELFEAEPFMSSFKECYEMILTSDHFDSYEACVIAAQELLTTLSSLLTQVTGKKYIVVSKLNPQYDPNGVEDGETWSSSTSLRLYLAEAKLFRKKIISYTIYANVNIAEDYLAVTHSLTPSTHQ